MPSQKQIPFLDATIVKYDTSYFKNQTVARLQSFRTIVSSQSLTTGGEVTGVDAVRVPSLGDVVVARVQQILERPASWELLGGLLGFAVCRRSLRAGLGLALVDSLDGLVVTGLGGLVAVLVTLLNRLVGLRELRLVLRFLRLLWGLRLLRLLWGLGLSWLLGLFWLLGGVLVVLVDRVCGLLSCWSGRIAIWTSTAGRSGRWDGRDSGRWGLV